MGHVRIMTDGVLAFTSFYDSLIGRLLHVVVKSRGWGLDIVVLTNYHRNKMTGEKEVNDIQVRNSRSSYYKVCFHSFFAATRSICLEMQFVLI